jgi:hypothetical protein
VAPEPLRALTKNFKFKGSSRKMNSVLEHLLDGVENNPDGIKMKMRSYIGRTIFTVHTSATLFYEVLGSTHQPISELSVHKETMEEFFERKHRITLQHKEIPAFICRGGHLVPPELTYFVEPPSV